MPSVLVARHTADSDLESTGFSGRWSIKRRPKFVETATRNWPYSASSIDGSGSPRRDPAWNSNSRCYRTFYSRLERHHWNCLKTLARPARLRSITQRPNYGALGWPDSRSSLMTSRERRLARPAGLEPATPGLEDRFLPFRIALFFGRSRNPCRFNEL